MDCSFYKIEHLNRMSKVFYKPIQTFRSIAENCSKADWLLPTVILTVLSLSSSWFTRPIVESARDAIIESQLLHFSVEQKESVLEIREAARSIGFLLSPILYFFILFVVGTVLFGLNKLLYGMASYEQVIAIYAYSSLIDAVKLLIITPIIISENTLDVHIGFGLLLSEQVSQTFIGHVIYNIDLFDIWQVLVVSIGLAVIGQISKRKTLGTVLGLWFIWLILNAFLANTITSIMSQR
ncbi:MAG: YIP1 family protein [Gemmatimonadetes bacterium]|nr:YIP1 family protein [Gemmatimonadota bacterium]